MVSLELRTGKALVLVGAAFLLPVTSSQLDETNELVCLLCFAAIHTSQHVQSRERGEARALM